MPDRHVQPSDGEWTVTVPGDDQVTARTATEVEAVERAVTIVAEHGGGQVVVHGEGGEVLDTRHVDADTEDVSRTAAEIAENTGVEGAIEAVERARGEHSDGDGGGDAAVGATTDTTAAPTTDATTGIATEPTTGIATDSTAGITADPADAAVLTGHTPEAVHAVGGVDQDDAGDADSESDSESDSDRDLADEAREAAQDAGEEARNLAAETVDATEDVAAEASTAATRVAGHTSTAARHAGATAGAAASGIGDEAEAVAEGDKSLEAAAKDTASIAQTTAGQVADQAEGTAREVAGETRAAGRRAAARVDATAREASEDLVAGADRAARLGAEAAEQADDTADRVHRQIVAVTEAVAVPLDQLAHALNPVRLTGRVVDVLVTGGLHLVGAGASRGTAAAQQGAHQVTGR
ncbi:DUF2188 domain-containing protein [Actinomycetospora lemnae]|uniref:DUF2188 domain-containing protein n=1 Tax=Actinomycetospora lemnae TaxID=3019891 RepID=A0ABT5SYP4_9PSEU|nr:DUF2188 domain-containing protein [Actinomycetospora sp. DW7H6]MDD7967836.1 DUF2188 domain-containing protein [Actinomycetospora sp. DW7H6]